MSCTQGRTCVPGRYAPVVGGDILGQQRTIGKSVQAADHSDCFAVALLFVVACVALFFLSFKSIISYQCLELPLRAERKELYLSV